MRPCVKKNGHTMKHISDDLASRSPGDPEALPDAAVQGFLRLLESVRLQDMPCREVFARLDEYVEKELSDHQAAQLMPLLREHLDICPDCCEEYEALLSALAQSSGDEKSERPGANPSGQ